MNKLSVDRWLRGCFIMENILVGYYVIINQRLEMTLMSDKILFQIDIK